VLLVLNIYGLIVLQTSVNVLQTLLCKLIIHVYHVNYLHYGIILKSNAQDAHKIIILILFRMNVSLVHKHINLIVLKVSVNVLWQLLINLIKHALHANYLYIGIKNYKNAQIAVQLLIILQENLVNAVNRIQYGIVNKINALNALIKSLYGTVSNVLLAQLTHSLMKQITNVNYALQKCSLILKLEYVNLYD